MKNLLITLALVLIILFSLTGCAKISSVTGSSSMTGATVQAVSFIDAKARAVIIYQPQRVATLTGSLAEMWQLAGGTLVVVTQDAIDERGMKLDAEVVNAGSLKTPDAERILAANPDFVILSANIEGHVALGETLENAGIQTAFFSVETFADYLSVFKTMTDITGRAELYEQSGSAVQARIDAAIMGRKAGAISPKVLLIRAFSSGAKAKGSDNMTGAMLRDLGCINIADGDTSLLEDLSMEKIITEDPDFIFVTTMGADDEALAALAQGLRANPAWSGLTAIREGRYVVLPKDLFHYKPNARWGESYEMLADILCGTPS